MTHNPVECAKCGRGKHVKPNVMAVFSHFVCCKAGAPKAKPQDDKPDPELSAARADPRQQWLQL